MEPMETSAAQAADGQLHIALCAVPMFGHFTPLLPYAEELLRRGHSVTIFHESDPKYRKKMEQCGLGRCESVPYEPKDSVYDSVLSHYEHRPTPGRRPDVMAYDFFATDAADAADRMGVPAVGIFPNPRSVNPWAATLEEQGTFRWALWSHVCTGLEAVLARLLWCMRTKKRWSRSLPLLREQDLYPSPYMPRHILGCMSETLEFKDLPPAPLYHMVGPSLPTGMDPMPEDLQGWITAQDKPIVYVAFGTQYRYTTGAVQQLQSDLLEAGVAVLWSLPKQNQSELMDAAVLPSHFRVEPFLPQVALLQSGKVSAFVTHCGSNSMNEALLSGVPMVCCPGLADQPANASRLARAGVGVIAKKKRVGAALKELMENLAPMTRRAQGLANELRSLEAAKKGADWIEQIAAEDYLGPQVKGPSRWPWWPIVIVAAALPLLIFL